MDTSFSAPNPPGSAAAPLTLELGTLGRVEVDPLSSLTALSLYRELDSRLPGALDRLFDFTLGARPDFTALPYPALASSGPAAGRGLTSGPEGWSANAVQTAGGFTIVAEGSTAWSIYGPGQLPGSEPLTRISGFPRVLESDGDNWGFNESSDFVLTDGTRIFCKTTQEGGFNVTASLFIVNGADRLEIGQLNTAKPTLSAVAHDGYEWRVNHDRSQVDTYYLGGSYEESAWFKLVGHSLEGEVTGAVWDPKTQRYEQLLDNKKDYWVEGRMRPQLGTVAWGNFLRSSLTDVLEDLQLPANDLANLARTIHADHSAAEFRTAFLALMRNNYPLAAQYAFYHAVSEEAESVLARFRDELRQRNSLTWQTFSLRVASIWR
jgi:hypothetical protein